MATYRSNPELAPYSNQFVPTNKYFDGYCQDPVSPSRSDSTNFTVTAFNIDYYPMIRLIVGPELTIDTFQVYLDCGNTVGDYWITDGRNTVCGTYDTLIQGMGENYYIVPGYEDEMVRDENGYYVIDPESEFIASKVIEHVYLDGNALDLNSNAVSSFPYTMYWLGHTPADEEPWAPALTRYYYGVSIANISHDHTISADVRTAELRIRDIEDNVNLALSPNPATSQVNVKVAGFNGKANCSILDMSGRVVYSTDITAGESVISLNGISAGAYFVRVTNDTFSKVEKLIVR